MDLYDKTTDTSKTISIDDLQWEIPTLGRNRKFRFADGADGRLQRALVFLIHQFGSTSTISKFLFSITNHWWLFKRLLEDGPSAVRVNWDEFVADSDVAKAAKSILKFASKARVGEWKNHHFHLVKSLASCDKVSRPYRSKMRTRCNVATPGEQAEIVKILDFAALSELVRLTDYEIEALSALALLYQHGVRPIQVLALRPNNLRVIKESDGRQLCLVSFHQAKQRGGQAPEMIRQVRPEWTNLLLRQHSIASNKNYSRLFRSTASHTLWALITRVALRMRVVINFTSNTLRYISGQALADNGHSRESIQRFLGHKNSTSASAYISASKTQLDILNEALGASKLYDRVIEIAKHGFADDEAMRLASEEEYIAGVVGDRLVAGIGICRGGQPSCHSDPVSGCYGCPRNIPSLNRKAHLEAIEGFRSQVRFFVKRGDAASPAFSELRTALAGAQAAVLAIDSSTS